METRFKMHRVTFLLGIYALEFIKNFPVEGDFVFYGINILFKIEMICVKAACLVEI